MTRFFLLFIFFPFIWISCSDDQFDIGRDNIDVKSKIAFIDTFTVSSYTVMLDSIPTSNLNDPAITVGRYDDPKFGTVTASSFFSVDLPSKVAGGTSAKYGIPDDAVFDSVRLFLIYNKYYEGDTLLPFTIDVHRLSGKFRPNTDGYFFNHDSIPAMSELFGQTTAFPSPNSGDSVWITLDHNFGTELFGLMKKNNLNVTNAESFEEYFKGLMIRYNENDRSVIGFHFPYSINSSNYPVMRVYYHYETSSIVKKVFDFKASPLLQFNRFTLRNRVIDFPPDQNQKLSSSLTQNESYVHAGVGIVTRLEIPYLKNLFYLGNDIQLLNAELEIEPAKNTYTEENLPAFLSLYTTDNLNRWGSAILNKAGNSAFKKLFIDMLYQEETRYTFEITNFIKSALADETDKIPAMLLTISAEDLYKTGERVILGSQKNIDNKVKLKLYYMNIE